MGKPSICSSTRFSPKGWQLLPLVLFLAVPPAEASQKTDKHGARCAAGSSRSCKKLYEMALESTDPSERIAAARALDGEELLVALAGSAPDPEVRQVCVGRILDQGVLSQIAERDASPSVRATAAAFVEDQEMLARVALTDAASRVRLAATKKIADGSLRFRLALEDEDSAVRRAAVPGVADPALLAHLALAASDARVRALALDGISDPTALVEVLLDPEFEERPGAEQVLERVTEEPLLARLALATRNPREARSAIHRMTDPALLTRVAAQASLPQARIIAIGRISEESVLAEIAIDDPDPSVREEAARSLKDWKLVQRVIQERGELARGRIHGKIFWNGLPQADVLVRLCGIDLPPGAKRWNGCSPSLETRTDEDGEYSFVVIPGDYAVLARSGDSWTYRTGDRKDRRVVLVDPSSGRDPFSGFRTVRYTASKGTSALADPLELIKELLLTSPAGGVQIPDLRPTLRWEAAEGAAYYLVSLSSTSEIKQGKRVLRHMPFSSIFYGERTSETWFDVPKSLTRKKAYLWSVKAFNAQNVKVAESTSGSGLFHVSQEAR